MDKLTEVLQERNHINADELALSEHLININRVSKVVKGGRHLSFSAVVTVGDGNGHVGMGMGKAREISEAIRKGNAVAKRGLIEVPMRGTTIPYEVRAKFGAAKVLLKPAAPGTGAIAGGAVRAVVEMAGIKDVVAKSLGSSNPINVAKATMLALSYLKNPDEELAKRKEKEESG